MKYCFKVLLILKKTNILIEKGFCSTVARFISIYIVLSVCDVKWGFYRHLHETKWSAGICIYWSVDSYLSQNETSTQRKSGAQDQDKPFSPLSQYLPHTPQANPRGGNFSVSSDYHLDLCLHVLHQSHNNNIWVDFCWQNSILINQELSETGQNHWGIRFTLQEPLWFPADGVCR